MLILAYITVELLSMHFVLKYLYYKIFTTKKKPVKLTENLFLPL
jgi:hypothetical protein